MVASPSIWITLLRGASHALPLLHPHSLDFCLQFFMNVFRYNHDELPSLVYNSALDMAVKMGHLPPSSPPLNALALRRGVVLDGQTGNVCVLNPLKRVWQFSHGFGALQDASSLYGETEIEMDGHRPGGNRWWVMGTHFELPFQQLFQLAVSNIDEREQDEQKRCESYTLMLRNLKVIINKL